MSHNGAQLCTPHRDRISAPGDTPAVAPAFAARPRATAAGPTIDAGPTIGAGPAIGAGPTFGDGLAASRPDLPLDGGSASSGTGGGSSVMASGEARRELALDPDPARTSCSGRGDSVISVRATEEEPPACIHRMKRAS